MPPKINEVIDNYRIIRMLGAGGMGAVYEAQHVIIGRRAAIKFLHEKLAKNLDIARRFVNEARAVNLVQHPALVEIFDFGYRDGEAYLIMEYLEGESLDKYCHTKGGRLAVSEVLPLARQIAQALVVVHDKQVFHRDLKPENVMLVPDAAASGTRKIKILDFGIAKVSAPDQLAGPVITRTGAVMGTPGYMPPEQYISTRDVDAKVDVYALGAILYQSLAGQPPFVVGPGENMFLRQMSGPPQPLYQVMPSVPRAVHTLVHEMLATEPKDRPTMIQVAHRLAVLERPPHARWAVVLTVAAFVVLAAFTLARMLLHQREGVAGAPSSHTPAAAVPSGTKGAGRPRAAASVADAPGTDSQAGGTRALGGALRSAAVTPLRRSPPKRLISKPKKESYDPPFVD